ncbi:MAG: hypothetical protein GWN62_16495 [Aliifodinibius sp.]|nr:hypothetical protein [Fodinibius sp.]
MKYGGDHRTLRKAGYEEKKYGFENLLCRLFGAGWEGFEASVGKPGNRAVRD